MPLLKRYPDTNPAFLNAMPLLKRCPVTRQNHVRRTQDGASPVSTGMLLLVSGPLHGRWRLLGRWRRRRGRRHGLDPHGRDSMAVHFFYYETAAIKINHLSSFGHLLQP